MPPLTPNPSFEATPNGKQPGMSRHLAKVMVVVVLAAAIYFISAVYLVGYSFGIAPGLEWLQRTFGQLGGTRIWAHLVHAIGLVIAALPAALLLHFALDRHAVRSALVAGTAAAIGALVPTFMDTEISSRLNVGDFMTMGIDSLEMVVILLLLTWLQSKLPSNNALERSARGRPRALQPDERLPRRPQAGAQRGR